MSVSSFHPEARDEALAAAQFYEQQTERLRQRFIESLADAVQKIEANPRCIASSRATSGNVRLSDFRSASFFVSVKSRSRLLLSCTYGENPAIGNPE